MFITALTIFLFVAGLWLVGIALVKRNAKRDALAARDELQLDSASSTPLRSTSANKRGSPSESPLPKVDANSRHVVDKEEPISRIQKPREPIANTPKGTSSPIAASNLAQTSGEVAAFAPTTTLRFTPPQLPPRVPQTNAVPRQQTSSGATVARENTKSIPPPALPADVDFAVDTPFRPRITQSNPPPPPSAERPKTIGDHSQPPPMQLSPFVAAQVAPLASATSAPRESKLETPSRRSSQSQAKSTPIATTNIRRLNPHPKFIGLDESIEFEGRFLRSPLTYFATGYANADPSTICTVLPVGHAHAATDLGYWPSYVGATIDQRAAYLDWMAGRRIDPNVSIGYPFIFFAGLERRSLVECEDELLCVQEVRRLLEIYGENRSFRGYSADFQSFVGFRLLETMTEEQVRAWYDPLIAEAASARKALLAWYCERSIGLPADLALTLSETNELARGGVVLDRSRHEFEALFCLRYRESFGDGLLLKAAKSRLVVEYRSASLAIPEAKRKASYALANVLGKPAQFNKIVELWNSCIEDLRSLTRKRAKVTDQALNAETWSALPAELRETVDHPDLDRWNKLVANSPRSRGVHLTTAGALASLAGTAQKEKLTPKHFTTLAAQAQLFDLAIEPDARITGKGIAWEAPVAIWRQEASTEVDPKLYFAVSNLLILLLTVAMADDVLDEREVAVITELVENGFSLDPAMRQRVEAVRELSLRTPSKANQIAKKIQEIHSRQDVLRTANLLVEVAGADGVVSASEREVLNSLFRNLGLASRDLESALLKSQAKIAGDDLVEVGSTTTHERGEAIPRPPTTLANEKAQEPTLDFVRIAKLQQETREIAHVLAAILDNDSEEDQSEAVQSGLHRSETPSMPKSSAVNPALITLDLRYHGILTRLVEKSAWPMPEIHALAKEHHLMPVGVAETLNCWSEDEFDDSLIEEGESWILNASIVERLHNGHLTQI
jgi:tellurite resistance protein